MTIMPISLIRLRNGHLSLEYETGDKARVLEAIRELFGEPSHAQAFPTFTVVRIGPADLISQDEWDDPCLISNSREGNAVLEAIARRLEAGHDRETG